MEWTSDNRQQRINNQPLMGVAKEGGDTAVKVKAVPAVNGAFRCPVDHGGSGKVCTNGIMVVDNSGSSSQAITN